MGKKLLAGLLTCCMVFTANPVIGTSEKFIAAEASEFSVTVDADASTLVKYNDTYNYARKYIKEGTATLKVNATCESGCYVKYEWSYYDSTQGSSVTVDNSNSPSITVRTSDWYSDDNSCRSYCCKVVEYVQGSDEEDYEVDQIEYNIDAWVTSDNYFSLDDSSIPLYGCD